MKESEYPVTARKLNNWIDQHLQVLSGLNRAWVEFTYPMRIGFDEESRHTSTTHRVIFVSLGFTGTEEECCKAMAAWLYRAVNLFCGRECWLDKAELLFIRTPFEYCLPDENTPDKPHLFGRVGFWRTDINRDLIKQVCHKPEGALPNKASMPTDMFGLP